MKEIWILGATGRIGTSVARHLSQKSCKLVLVGRNQAQLGSLASEVGPDCKTFVASSAENIAALLRHEHDVVVCNFIGPFTVTADVILQALNPGCDYLDLSNDSVSVLGTLGRNEQVKLDGQCVITGAGYGVLAVESLVLALAAKRKQPYSVRVDSIPYIDSPGPVGATVAATIVDAIPAGGAVFADGKYRKARMGAHYLKLTLPDGSTAGAGAASTGDLIVAQRSSGAKNVVAGSSMVPGSPVVGVLMSLMAPLFRVPVLKEFFKKQFAKMPGSPASPLRKHSWIHAKLEWRDGSAIEGWLKLGEGMEFTARAASEVAFRLANHQGRPGAFTPGAIFGTTLARNLGAELITDEPQL